MCGLHEAPRRSDVKWQNFLGPALQCKGHKPDYKYTIMHHVPYEAPIGQAIKKPVLCSLYFCSTVRALKPVTSPGRQLTYSKLCALGTSDVTPLLRGLVVIEALRVFPHPAFSDVAVRHLINLL